MSESCESFFHPRFHLVECSRAWNYPSSRWWVHDKCSKLEQLVDEFRSLTMMNEGNWEKFPLHVPRAALVKPFWFRKAHGDEKKFHKSIWSRKSFASKKIASQMGFFQMMLRSFCRFIASWWFMEFSEKPPVRISLRSSISFRSFSSFGGKRSALVFYVIGTCFAFWIRPKLH